MKFERVRLSQPQTLVWVGGGGRITFNWYFNPLTPKGFCVFERFSAYTRPMGFHDCIFKVTIESAAVLKH